MWSESGYFSEYWPVDYWPDVSVSEPSTYTGLYLWPVNGDEPLYWPVDYWPDVAAAELTGVIVDLMAPPRDFDLTAGARGFGLTARQRQFVLTVREDSN